MNYTWRTLNAALSRMSEHQVKELLDEEINGPRRIKMLERLHQLPQPVIAMVHGIATAAGCQLVAACDLAIAEEGARFATPGVRIGLFCTTPMVPLVRLVGRRRAAARREKLSGCLALPRRGRQRPGSFLDLPRGSPAAG